MLSGRVSFVKACQDFFSSEPFGRKVEIRRERQPGTSSELGRSAASVS